MVVPRRAHRARRRLARVRRRDVAHHRQRQAGGDPGGAAVSPDGRGLSRSSGVNARVGPGTNGKVTLREVASLAGVHPATASRALNQETRGLVREETARRVEDAARQLDYRPDHLARSLKTAPVLHRRRAAPRPHQPALPADRAGDRGPACAEGVRGADRQHGQRRRAGAARAGGDARPLHRRAHCGDGTTAPSAARGHRGEVASRSCS